MNNDLKDHEKRLEKIEHILQYLLKEEGNKGVIYIKNDSFEVEKKKKMTRWERIKYSMGFNVVIKDIMIDKQ